jgi:hypothetical protein
MTELTAEAITRKMAASSSAWRNMAFAEAYLRHLPPHFDMQRRAGRRPSPDTAVVDLCNLRPLGRVLASASRCH